MEFLGLRDLVAEHTITYEIWPHYDMTPEGDRVMNGFDLELHGTHSHGHTRLTPGCDLCSHTYRDLRMIGETVLPTEVRPSEYEIPPFDHALHSRPGREAEVVLVVHIKHRHEYFAPVDQCEETCLREMAEKLAELGVRGTRGSGFLNRHRS
jgi:hypothetical protein